MKVLVVCQYYYPEPVRITDICEELVKKGHEVTILTSVPNYPMGDIYEDYKKRKNRKEIINGVQVLRCITIPRKKNKIMRFLNYHGFSFFSKRYIKKLDKDFDVIFVNQLSPIMMANAAIKYKNKYGKKIIMYCLDIWPESLCVGGIKKGSLIYKIYFIISRKIYRSMDKIFVTSKSFIEYLNKSFDIEKSKIDFLPQHAEALFNNTKCHKTANKKIDLLFAGNIGKAQSIDTIIDAAEILKNNKKIVFHIVGDGQELEKLKVKVSNKQLQNIIFYGRKPIEDMPKYYKKADAMLVTLCGNSLISLTLPGKVQTYMAAGKPIIASANGETKLIIEEAKCGFCSPADNGEELARAINKFINCKDKEKLASNAYRYYKNNYDKSIFIEKLIQELEKKRI